MIETRLCSSAARGFINPPPLIIMKGSCLSSARAVHGFVALAASALLVQCSMPSRQAWQYIQTNGLLNYWGYSAQKSSPPFRLGASGGTQRYAATSRSYSIPRTTASSPWRYPSTQPYYPSRYLPQRYFSSTPPSRSGSVVPRSTSGSASSSRPSSSERTRGSSPPPQKIPLEAPSSTPQIVTSNPPKPPPSAATESNAGAAVKPAAKPAADLPYGTIVPGRANMVNSPYAGKTQLVDVSGMGPGQTVKCPYTGKLFKVPPAAQAENKAAPRQEAKLESPNLSSEPKKDDKQP